MPTALERLSIRSRLVLFAAAILLPAGLMLVWFLATEVVQAREAAHEKVRILAMGTAATLQARLIQAEALLAQLAARPLVKTLDAARCDPIVSSFVPLSPEYLTLDLRDARGSLVCSMLPIPARALNADEARWFATAWRASGFTASGSAVDPRTARKIVSLSYPVRDDAGRQVGLVVLDVDLLILNRQLLAATPADAVVTVADAARAVVLRSIEPAAFIGTLPPASGPDPAGGAREGLLSTMGRDGVPRLFAFVTLPGLDWRVAAGLPEASVFAPYRDTLRRTLGLVIVLVLMALALAWRVSSAIVRPIAQLAAAAEAAAGGQARATEAGPPEIRKVDAQFNRMLDARDAAESARCDADARYRLLVDWLPDAISVHVGGRVRFVNRACAELLGREARDLIGTSSLDVLHREDQQAAQAQVDTALSTGQVIAPRDQRFIRGDGVSIDVEVSGTPIMYEGEAAVLAAMRDITPRKLAEERLARSEAQLRGIVESATVAIITIDEQQTILSANPAAASMFGYRPDELPGASLERLLPPKQRAAHGDNVRRFGLLETASRHMGRARDVMGLRASGEEFPIDAAISHLSLGRERLYTVIMRDVSERRRAEDALRSSEAALRRLLVTLPEAVLVYTAGRISFVNEAARALFGSDEAGLLGREPLSLVHPDSREPVRARIARLADGDSALPLQQVKIVRADDEVRLADLAVTQLDEHGQGTIVVVMRDVTALVEAQQALAGSHAELQRLLAVRDRVQEDERKRIARELHDDLQQTLAAIRINLVASAQRLDSAPEDVAPLLEETSELAATALESTRRMINDLRPQMLEDLGLMPALEALATQFSRRTGIACRVRGFVEGGRVGPLPAATATCLYRVAQESLANVAKHAGASHVRILLLRGSDDRVLLRIRDDGRGMVTGEPRKPASFGLLGMQERVRALAATLRVHSEPGAGMTIEVTVPPPSTVAVAAPGAAPDGGGEPAGGDASTHLLPAVVDALGGNVAVLDRQGTIMLVNHSWQAHAALGSSPSMLRGVPGENYLEVCRRRAPADPFAERALQGMTAVLNGGDASFVLEYPCQTPDGLRWFRMHAAPIDNHQVLLTHIDVAVQGDAPSVGSVRGRR
jgi:PAS domain S-box-containing protein